MEKQPEKGHGASRGPWITGKQKGCRDPKKLDKGVQGRDLPNLEIESNAFTSPAIAGFLLHCYLPPGK